jgi:hypothetical protein
MDTMLKHQFLKLNRKEKISALKMIAAGQLKLVDEIKQSVEFFSQVAQGWESHSNGQVFTTEDEVIRFCQNQGHKVRVVLFKDYSQPSSSSERNITSYSKTPKY